MLGTLSHMQQRRNASAEYRAMCKHCKKTFVREDRYMVHECKQMKRLAELKAPSGQAAYNYYSLWMRAKHRNPPGQDAFVSSNYFRTFNNFVAFTKKVNLPDPQRFIRVMVQKDWSPTMWMEDYAYVEYLEWMDRTMSPLEHATQSIQTLQAFCDAREVPDTAFFDTILPNELAQMIRGKQLSPWLLIFSARYRDFVKTKTSTEQRLIIENLVRPEYWIEKMQAHPAEVKKIKEWIAALGI